MTALVIDQRRKSLGALEIGRVLPHVSRRMVGPFVFFDHIGPVDMAPGFPRDADVRPHPHIGLSTVTYLFNGEMRHRDSLGYLQDIRPGELNWILVHDHTRIAHQRREYAKGRKKCQREVGMEGRGELPGAPGLGFERDGARLAWKNHRCSCRYRTCPRGLTAS